jgi:hypothetical protein
MSADIALRDNLLCRRILDDLRPLADTCAVNGALVCFMGAHAHRIGLVHAALGHAEPAHHWLTHALQIHHRLGARAWQTESYGAIASLGGPEAAADISDDVAQLRRIGDMWQASYRGHTAYLRDTKGLHDLADLLANPGADLSALSLAGGEMSRRAHSGPTDTVVDRTALLAYRRRLDELNDELTTAQAHSDLARQQLATDEREQLLAELRRATRPDGSPRAVANTAAERARKAVTARIRDAIRRITEAHPELGAHLDRTVHTGAICRYEPNSSAR